MIFIKWVLLSILSIAFTILCMLLTPVLCLFTGTGWPDWGSWFWTYDNPPQGDNGFKTRWAPFKQAGTPFELYVNRVFWLWRNPSYGFDKMCGVQHSPSMHVYIGGNENTNDRNAVPGYYFARCLDQRGNLVAFEFYVVSPWCKTMCLNLRFGWKITTEKFVNLGFAQIVFSINPFKTYGS